MANLIRGVSYKPHNVSRSENKSNIPLLRAGNIQEEINAKDDLIWVDDSIVSESQILRYGDIAICLSSGSAKVVGKTAVYQETFPATVGAFCGIIRAKEVVDQDYLSHWFRSKEFLDWRDSQARGANIQNLRFSELAKLQVDLPDLPTQRRIAAKLKEQLAEVEKARKAAEDAAKDSERLLDHYLREVFEHVVPLSTNPINPVTPKDWAWAPLMELARLESGHTPSRRHPEYWENGDIPWLALPDIRALDCQVAMETSEKINKLGLANSSARLCPVDTVAMCRTASVGYVTILGRPMATTQHFTNWICGERILPRFLMWLLRASRSFTKSIASGSILPDIYMNVVHNFHICFPSLYRQQAIISKLDAIQSELKKLEDAQTTHRDALNKLPAAYLREAFSAA